MSKLRLTVPLSALILLGLCWSFFALSVRAQNRSTMPSDAAGSSLVSNGASQPPMYQTKPMVDVRDYKAVCDGASHPLSGYYSTLAAARAVYPFVTSLKQELDYVAVKAAANVAFGPDGSEHAAKTGLNSPLLLPAGTCMFGNDELLISNADGIIIQGSGKTATVLTGNGIVLGFDGLWYSKLSDFEVVTTGSSAIVALDIDGNVPGHPYRTRTVQGNMLQDIMVGGGGSTYALTFCRQGGSNAQCSENTFVNLHLSNASDSALFINGFNAIDNVWIGGDVQAYGKNGIYLSNSTLKEIGVSFEPGGGCAQLNNGGADIYAAGGVGGSVVAIGSRTEGLSFLHVSGAVTYVSGFTQNAALNTWTANYSVTLNEATEQTGSDGNKHLYCATAAGTSGAVAPTWPATGTVSDGTAVWTTTPFASLTFGQGMVDYSSAFIDPAAIPSAGGGTWQFGTWNNPGGWYASDWVTSTFSESYLQSQSAWQDFYTNPQAVVEASHYQPTYNLPAKSVGVIAGSTGWTIAAKLKFGTDNTYDIGGREGNRPRDIWLGRNADIAGNLTVHGRCIGCSSEGEPLTSEEREGRYSTPWITAPNVSGNTSALPRAANKAAIYGVVLTFPLTTTQVTYDVTTADASANTYDIGIYSNTGKLKAHTGPAAGSEVMTAGVHHARWTEGATLEPGKYYLAIASSCRVSCGQMAAMKANGVTFLSNYEITVSVSGSLNGNITAPPDTFSFGSTIPAWILQ